MFRGFNRKSVAEIDQIVYWILTYAVFFSGKYFRTCHLGTVTDRMHRMFNSVEVF